MIKLKESGPNKRKMKQRLLQQQRIQGRINLELEIIKKNLSLALIMKYHISSNKRNPMTLGTKHKPQCSQKDKIKYFYHLRKINRKIYY